MSTFSELVQSTFSRVLGKIPVRGTMTTPSGSETYPIVLCNEVMGGIFIVDHIDHLKTIPLERLLRGCKCTVNEFTGDDSVQVPTTTYQLSRLPLSTDFTEYPVLVGGVPTGEKYYELNSYNEFWVLDAPKQQETGTLQYQYSDNYENKQPPYTEPAITKLNYQDGYADNSRQPEKLIWSDTFDAGVHKWQRQKVGVQSDWSIPVSITSTFEANDFIDDLYQWTENSLGGTGVPVNPGAPPSLVDGHSNSSPVGWEDVPPTPPTDYLTYIQTHSLWETSATKDGYYNLKSVWSTPKLVSTNPDLVRYGQNYNALFDPMSSEWHVFYEPNDLFKASRINTSSAWVVERIRGESGEYTDGVYKAFSITLDPPPTAERLDLAPTSLLGYGGTEGWQDGPFTPEAGYILYKSECRKRANGTQITSWSGPMKANGDSTVRVVIVPQGNGESRFKYTQVDGVKTIAPASIILGLEVYDGINRLDLGALPSQYRIDTWSKNSVSLINSNTTLSINHTAVSNSEVYGIQITYGTKTYTDFITISDVTDGVGYVALIYSSTGFTYKDEIDKTFQAQLYENGSDITTYPFLSYVWKLNGTVLIPSSGNTRTIAADLVSGSAILTVEITKDSTTTYTATETLVDIVDGAALVRYYSTSETAPDPLQPPNGSVPVSDGITWTTTPTGAIWVVERLSNTLVWNPAYRVKGEKGVPNGGFQKTIYWVSSTGAPATPIDGGSSLTPVDWLETPPATMNTGDTTYGSTAMFLKNPGTTNMDLTRANWTISGFWSTPFQLTSSFVGGTGVQGPQGNNGWNPQVRLKPFTGSGGQSYIAHELYGWVGGTLPAPTAVGIISPSGLLTVPNDSCNVRGLQGVSGQGIVGEDYWDKKERFTYTNLPNGAQLTLEFHRAKSGIVYWTCYGSGYSSEGDSLIRVYVPGVYRPVTNASYILHWFQVLGGDGVYPKYIKFHKDYSNGGSYFTLDVLTKGNREINTSGTYYIGPTF